MKPAFALDFRDGAVALLHRTARGWMSVGQTAFDSPDFDEALAFLRSTALGLAPGGLSTKLIIPNDQILFTTVDAPGPDAAKRRKQIAAALEGRTPYDVADLVFDWWGKGATVEVAAVARETLAEAEAFASQHRFNPVAFVAVPDNGLFMSEPWFGPSSVAGEILAPGEKVDRDQDPVQMLGHAAPEPVAATPPAPEAVREPEFDPAPAAQPEPEPEPLPVPEPEPEPEPLPIPMPEPEPAPFDPAPEPEPEPELPPPFDPAPAAPVEIPADAPEDLPDAYPDELPSADPFPDDVPDMAPFEDMAAKKPPALMAATSPAPAPVDDLPDEAPMALDVVDEGPAAQDEDLPASPALSIIQAFNARRGNGAGTSGTVTAPSIAPPNEPSIQPESAGMAVIGSAKAASGTAPRLAAERPALARPLPANGAKAPARSVGQKALKGFGALVTAPSIAGGKRAKVKVPQSSSSPSPVQASNGQSPARPAQRPIGLGARTMPQRGKPKFLGLILTGILLVFLALVAAWSTYFLPFSQADAPADTAVASADTPAETAVDPAADGATEAASTIDDEMLADQQDPADFAGSPAEADAAAEADTLADAVDPAETPAAAEPAPDTGLASAEAATPAPAGVAQDEIFLAAIDTPPQPPDPLSLTTPEARSDALPDPAVPPPPFGTVYKFDADGRIVPTPEGIATPEGVLLIAGKPPLVPTSRSAVASAAAAAAAPPAAQPETPAPDAAQPTGPGNPSTLPTNDQQGAAAIAEDPTADAAATTISTASANANPELQGKRPGARPAGFVPPEQTAQDPALAPANGTRVASLRPQPRPAAVLALAAPPAPAADPAADAAAEAVAADVAQTQSASLVTQGEVLPAPSSPLAVEVSRKPASRPKGLKAAIAAPAPDEPAANASTASAAASNSASPEADGEPETEGKMPALPSSASVSKQATVKNAVNLSKLTLIGVYGSESKRYAYVRQANGRLVKVKVGDRLDGGKVVAITTSEVRVQKGSKVTALTLPKT